MKQSTPLLDALINFGKQNITKFDVPGHKSGSGIEKLSNYFGKKVMNMDVNSMKQLDNLSNPIGVIKEAEDLTAIAFGADAAFFLVNGTTSGIQAMIMSTCNPGDKIIIPRNVHKSALNSLILCSALPVYIQPEINKDLGISMGMTLKSVKQAILDHPDAKAVFIINPTYYGYTSNIEEIIELAHANDMMVLMDEAHGAHFNFHDELPDSGIKYGADIAAVSMHKTGGSLTQSSILLMNEGKLKKDYVKTVLNLIQTTSASYLLMASLDIARANFEENGKEQLTEIINICRNARNKINKIDGLHAFSKEILNNKGTFDFDESKLGVNVAGIGLSGLEVYDILREEYDIQIELADAYNILAIVSLGDTKETVERLIKALEDISNKYRKAPLVLESLSLENPEVIIPPRKAFYAPKHRVKLEESIGEVSGESIMIYPPGIPIVSPGEKITKKMIEFIKFLKDKDSMLNGMEDPTADHINILNL